MFQYIFLLLAAGLVFKAKTYVPAPTLARVQKLRLPNIAVTHKWGTFFTMERLQNFSQHNFLQSIPPTIDEPTVIIARNIFDSIVSGYLYHKSGKECWSSPRGQEVNTPNLRWSRRIQWLQHFPWKKKVTLVPHPEDTRPKSMCEILHDWPEDVGVPVYAEFALKLWIEPAITLLQTHTHTIYRICLEDFTEHSDERIGDINNFLQTRRKLWDYSGNHATTKNATTRERIQKLVRETDSKYLRDRLRLAQNLYGCSKSNNAPKMFIK